jgi:hypothetical protein
LLRALDERLGGDPPCHFSSMMLTNEFIADFVLE